MKIIINITCIAANNYIIYLIHLQRGVLVLDMVLGARKINIESLFLVLVIISKI